MNISEKFSGAAGKEDPRTDFFAYLERTFDRETAQGVMRFLHGAGLPPPQGKEEFLPGTEGCLLFLNPYGLVIRIENTEFDEDNYWKPDRINTSGYVLSPLAAVRAGRATIELCPGCHLEKDYASIESLYESLRHEGIDFWDRVGMGNSGRLPLKTPSFPEGVPVVIDRLAVRKLSDSLREVSAAVKKAAEEALKAQRELYGPLKKAFRSAWPNPEKMAAFWELCRQQVEEGRLVAGWNEAKEEANLYGGFVKPYWAKTSAKSYEERLKP